MTREDAKSVTELPGWLSSASGPVAAWTQMPADRRAIGVVVLCPSAARELTTAARTLQVLGLQLAEAGFAVIRLDWTGTANSGPLTSDDALGAWYADLDAAVDFAAQWGSGLPVHLVGLRLGASIAASWPGSVDGVRLAWEPVGGRSFIRRSGKLRVLSCEVPRLDESEGVELCGMFLSPGQAHSVEALPNAKEDLSRRVRVRMEEDPAVAARLHSSAPQFAQIPFAALRSIVSSLPLAPAKELGDFSLPACATFANESGSIVEEFVSVGQDKLHSILTRPSGAAVGAVAFTSAGAEPLDGPSGLWAVAARELAREGCVCLRTERRRTGVHVDRTSPGEPDPYGEAPVEDVVAELSYLHALTGMRPVAVGVCVGAWLFMRAAERAPVSRILAVDNLIWHPDPRVAWRMARGPLIKRFLPSVPVADGGNEEALASAGMRGRLRVLLKAMRDAGRDNMPLTVRRIGAAFSWWEYPPELLERVPDSVAVELHFGVLGADHFAKVQGPNSLLKDSSRTLSCHVWPDLDHSALGETSRRRILTLLRPSAEMGLHK